MKVGILLLSLLFMVLLTTVVSAGPLEDCFNEKPGDNDHFASCISRICDSTCAAWAPAVCPASGEQTRECAFPDVACERFTKRQATRDCTPDSGSTSEPSALIEEPEPSPSPGSTSDTPPPEFEAKRVDGQLQLFIKGKQAPKLFAQKSGDTFKFYSRAEDGQYEIYSISSDLSTVTKAKSEPVKKSKEVKATTNLASQEEQQLLLDLTFTNDPKAWGEKNAEKLKASANLRKAYELRVPSTATDGTADPSTDTTSNGDQTEVTPALVKTLAPQIDSLTKDQAKTLLAGLGSVEEQRKALGNLYSTILTRSRSEEFTEAANFKTEIERINKQYDTDTERTRVINEKRDQYFSRLKHDLKAQNIEPTIEDDGRKLTYTDGQGRTISYVFNHETGQVKRFVRSSEGKDLFTDQIDSDQQKHLRKCRENVDFARTYISPAGNDASIAQVRVHPQSGNCEYIMDDGSRLSPDQYKALINDEGGFTVLRAYRQTQQGLGLTSLFGLDEKLAFDWGEELFGNNEVVDIIKGNWEESICKLTEGDVPADQGVLVGNAPFFHMFAHIEGQRFTIVSFNESTQSEQVEYLYKISWEVDGGQDASKAGNSFVFNVALGPIQLLPSDLRVGSDGQRYYGRKGGSAMAFHNPAAYDSVCIKIKNRVGDWRFSSNQVCNRLSIQ